MVPRNSLNVEVFSYYGIVLLAYRVKCVIEQLALIAQPFMASSEPSYVLSRVFVPSYPDQ
ncbi:MAG: hypothetical protein ACP5T5_02655 [Thermoprotei archaeon]